MCAAASAAAANSLCSFALKRDVMLMCHSGSAADPSHRRSNKCCSLKVMPATNQAATTGAGCFNFLFLFFRFCHNAKRKFKNACGQAQPMFVI